MEKLEMFDVWKKVRVKEMSFSKFMIQLSMEIEEINKINFCNERLDKESLKKGFGESKK